MPAPPFTTSSMQQEAGRKLSFTTSRTMQIVQQLYEGVEIAGEGIQGLVTYIRTDSPSFAPEFLPELENHIKETYGESYYAPIREGKKGENVQMIGFGTLAVVKKAARKGINPATKAVINIPAKKVVKFRAGAKLAL